MADQNKNKNAKDEQTQMNKFIKEFEELMEKYEIKEYISVQTLGESEFALYKPDDIMTITKKLKVAHRQYYHQVMVQIGETN